MPPSDQSARVGAAKASFRSHGAFRLYVGLALRTNNRLWAPHHQKPKHDDMAKRHNGNMVQRYCGIPVRRRSGIAAFR